MTDKPTQLSFFDLYSDVRVGEGDNSPSLGKLLAILEEAKLVAADYDRHKPREIELKMFVDRYRGITITRNRSLQYDLTMARVVLKFLKGAPMRLQSLKRQAEDMEAALNRNK